VQVRSAASNLVSAQSGVNMSKLQLKMLMGLEMGTALEVEGSLNVFEKNMFGDMLSIDTTSLKSNTDLNQFDIKSKQLDHALKIQKTSWWPTLAASFNYQYMSMTNDGAALNFFPMSNAAVQLSIPIFQGGARVYKEKQLKIQMDQMKDQRDNLRRSLEMQAITFLDNIKKAIEKIESNKEGLRQAEKAVSISQKMYEVGSSTYLDLSNAELSYIQAGLMYNQSIFDYLSAKADLEKLLSKDAK
jgi:outer membrane protein TolC